MRGFLWMLTIMGSVLGAIVVFHGILNANSAPQEASAAAIGIAMAVLPYCLARGFEEMMKD